MKEFPRERAMLFAVATILSLCACDPSVGAKPDNQTSKGDPSAAPSSSQTQTGPNERMPDLAMLPLQSFHLAFEGGKKVLRFEADLANMGNGPLDLTGIRTKTQEPNLRVTQRILQSDGSQRVVKTGAVMSYSMLDGHDHFHVKNFERYRLKMAGTSTWREAHKEGFCLRDDGNLRGTTSRYPDADFDCGADMKDEALQVHQGLTEGWVDVYEWYIEGQFIELDGLQLPGDFCVEAQADPEGLLSESSRDNNLTSTLVHLTESQVTVVREGC